MLREKHYKRIVHEVERDIRNGKYKIGDKIPSINAWRIHSGLSRSSVVLAMEELKNRGLIEPEQSVGYFVSSTRVESTHRILLIFNELNGFKRVLYDAIIESLGKGSVVDIVFYNFNRETFDILIEQHAGKYSVYMVMAGRFENIDNQLRKLGGKVIIIDSCNNTLRENIMFPAVIQYFAQDTYDALVSALTKLRKYREIVLIQSESKEPHERYEGIRRFCQDYDFECSYFKSVVNLPIKRGGVYITPEDTVIVDVMMNARKQNLRAGVDFGLITYNERRLNEILCDGLNTITTDFVRMGKIAVELIQANDCRIVRNPYRVIFRNTL